MVLSYSSDLQIVILPISHFFNAGSFIECPTVFEKIITFCFCVFAGHTKLSLLCTIAMCGMGNDKSRNNIVFRTTGSNFALINVAYIYPWNKNKNSILVTQTEAIFLNVSAWNIDVLMNRNIWVIHTIICCVLPWKQHLECIYVYNVIYIHRYLQFNAI